MFVLIHFVVYTDDLVENWLNNIVKEMRKSVRFSIKQAVYEYGKNREQPRTQWIENNACMVCVAASQIWWTAEVEEVFARIKHGEKDEMKKFLCQLNEQIGDSSEKSMQSKENLFPYFWQTSL